jgi:hypothetical protein
MLFLLRHYHELAVILLLLLLPQAVLDKIEKELQSWTEGNKKDVIYILGQNLLFSKDPIARAEAWRQLNKIIEYYEDPNSP